MTTAANDRLTLLSPSTGATTLSWDWQLARADGMRLERVRAGATAALELGVDYSFPGGLGTAAGGTLTLAAPTLAGDQFRLIGLVPEDRQSDFQASQIFDTAKQNADLDHLTRIAQEHRRDIGRSWKSDFGTASGLVKAGAPGQFAYFDNDGNIAAVDVTPELTVLPGGALECRTYADFLALTSVPLGTTLIRVLGRNAAGDGGAQEWVYSATQPAHAYRRQIDGNWFELAGIVTGNGRVVTPEMFGAATSANVVAALTAGNVLGLGVEVGDVELEAVATYQVAGAGIRLYHRAGTAITVDPAAVGTYAIGIGGATVTGALSEWRCSGNGRTFVERHPSTTVTADVAAGSFIIPMASVSGLSVGMLVRIEVPRLVRGEHRDSILQGFVAKVKAIDGLNVELDRELPFDIAIFEDELTVDTADEESITVTDTISWDRIMGRKVELFAPVDATERGFRYITLVDEASKTIWIRGVNGYRANPIDPGDLGATVTVTAYASVYFASPAVNPVWEGPSFALDGGTNLPRAFNSPATDGLRIRNMRVNNAQRLAGAISFSVDARVSGHFAENVANASLGYQCLFNDSSDLTFEDFMARNCRRGGPDVGGEGQSWYGTVTRGSIDGGYKTNNGVEWSTDLNHGVGPHGQAAGWRIAQITARNVGLLAGDRGELNTFSKIVGHGRFATVFGIGSWDFCASDITVLPPGDDEGTVDRAAYATLINIGPATFGPINVTGLVAQDWIGGAILSANARSLRYRREPWLIAGDVELGSSGSVLAFAATDREIHAPTDCLISGDYAIVIAQGEAISADPGVHAYLKTTPTTPTIAVSGYPSSPDIMSGAAGGLLLNGDLLVACAGRHGIARFDASDLPNSFDYLDEYVGSGWVEGSGLNLLSGVAALWDCGSNVVAAAVRNRDYVAFIDYTDPAAPVLLGTVTGLDQPWDFRQKSGALFVTCANEDAVAVIDIATRTLLTKFTHADIDDPRGLEIKNDILFVACAGSAQIVGLDVSTETSPAHSFTFTGPSPGESLSGLGVLKRDGDVLLGSLSAPKKLVKIDISTEGTPVWGAATAESSSTNRVQALAVPATGYVYAVSTVSDQFAIADTSPGLTLVGSNISSAMPVVYGPPIDVSGLKLRFKDGAGGSLVPWTRCTLRETYLVLPEAIYAGVRDDHFVKIACPASGPRRVRIWQEPAGLALDAVVSVDTTGAFTQSYSSTGFAQVDGPYTGTTGTDGNVSVTLDGTYLWIENRSGSDQHFFVQVDGATIPIKTLGNVTALGIATAANTIYPLDVAAADVRLAGVPVGSGGDGDLRIHLTKEGASDFTNIDFETAGSARARIQFSTDNTLTVNGSTDGSSFTKAFTVPNNGALLIGSTGWSSTFNGFPFEVSTGAQTPTPQINQAAAIVRFAASGSLGPRLSFGRGLSNTFGTMTAVASGHLLGEILTNGADGTQFRIGGGLSFIAAGGPTSDRIPTHFYVNTVTTAGVARRAAAVLADGDLVLGASNSDIVIDANRHVRLRSYTVATLPSASPAGQLIYVSDGTSNKRLAVSDGTNFRFPDGNVVS